MIASDTSTWIAFLEGNSGEDVEMLTKALVDRQVVMAPAVLTELLSDPELPSSAAHTLSDLPLIDIRPGYWQRAGSLRAQVLAKRRKARLGDALIAQSCIDGGVPLITRDRDFQAFAETAGLNLILQPEFRSCGDADPMHVLDMKRVGVYTVQLSLPDFAHPGRSLENRIHASDTLGIRGIVEHALSDSARAFYLALGFKQSPGQPLTRTITVKELQAALVP